MDDDNKAMAVRERGTPERTHEEMGTVGNR